MPKKGRFDGCILLAEYMYAKSGDKCHNNVGIVDIRKKFSYLFRPGRKVLAATKKNLIGKYRTALNSEDCATEATLLVP